VETTTAPEKFCEFSDNPNKVYPRGALERTVNCTVFIPETEVNSFQNKLWNLIFKKILKVSFSETLELFDQLCI
jgi:hypothetical protein